MCLTGPLDASHVLSVIDLGIQRLLNLLKLLKRFTEMKIKHLKAHETKSTNKSRTQSSRSRSKKKLMGTQQCGVQTQYVGSLYPLLVVRMTWFMFTKCQYVLTNAHCRHVCHFAYMGFICATQCLFKFSLLSPWGGWWICVKLHCTSVCDKKCQAYALNTATAGFHVIYASPSCWMFLSLLQKSTPGVNGK